MGEGVGLECDASLTAQMSSISGDTDTGVSGAHQSELTQGQGSTTAQTSPDSIQPGQTVSEKSRKSVVISGNVEAADKNNGSLEKKITTGYKSVNASKLGTCTTERCFTPKIDISIPPRPKSSSLASRRAKESTSITSEPVIDEIPNKLVGRTDLENVPKQDLDAEVQTHQGTAQPTSHFSEHFSGSESLGAAKQNKSLPQKSEKVSVTLAKQDKSVISGNSVGSQDSHAPKNVHHPSKNASTKQTKTAEASRNKSPAAVCRQTSSQPAASVSVKNETKTFTKSKHQQEAKKEVAAQRSKTKPVYV